MEFIKICGIDPSIKSTGKTIMKIKLSDFSIQSIKFYSYHPFKKREFKDDLLDIECVGNDYEKKSILERQRIAYKIIDKDMDDVKFIAFEGYAYSKARGSSNSRGMIQLGEFIGSLKYKYYIEGKGILTYPSTSIKLFATGRGDADKILMQKYFKKDYPQFYHDYFDNIMVWENPCSDIIDSFWICEALRVHMKLDILGSKYLKESELILLQNHTAKSEPICNTKILKISS